VAAGGRRELALQTISTALMLPHWRGNRMHDRRVAEHSVIPGKWAINGASRLLCSVELLGKLEAEGHPSEADAVQRRAGPDAPLCGGAKQDAAGDGGHGRWPASSGLREIALEPDLVRLLREHKVAVKESEPDDFIFADRIRDKARERNSVRTKILYPAIERANEQLASEDRPPFPEGSPSTRCAGPTRRCAPSLASIPP
jgi:hypothetical protein